MIMLDSLLRVIVTFLSLVVWSRIVGKKLISHMTFFDFIAGVTFGAIGGNMIFNKLVPLWMGLVNLSAFSLLVLLSDYISLHSIWGRQLLEGKPSLIIERGQIQVSALRSMRLTVDDLLMLLRKKNIFYMDEVECAYFETDGTLSILKKPLMMSVTRKDMDLHAESRGLPESCIIEGKMISDSLGKVGKSEQWIVDYLETREIQLKQVLLAQIDRQGNVYLDLGT
jgi:uncharacterized membrane protein YcaP (DUF421 family)